eukprot:jgi/Mesvir1/4421/Mv11915-RA.2
MQGKKGPKATSDDRARRDLFLHLGIPSRRMARTGWVTATSPVGWSPGPPTARHWQIATSQKVQAVSAKPLATAAVTGAANAADETPPAGAASSKSPAETSQTSDTDVRHRPPTPQASDTSRSSSDRSDSTDLVIRKLNYAGEVPPSVLNEADTRAPAPARGSLRDMVRRFREEPPEVQPLPVDAPQPPAGSLCPSRHHRSQQPKPQWQQPRQQPQWLGDDSDHHQPPAQQQQQRRPTFGSRNLTANGTPGTSVLRGDDGGWLRGSRPAQGPPHGPRWVDGADRRAGYTAGGTGARMPDGPSGEHAWPDGEPVGFQGGPFELGGYDEGGDVYRAKNAGYWWGRGAVEVVDAYARTSSYYQRDGAPGWPNDYDAISVMGGGLGMDDGRNPRPVLSRSKPWGPGSQGGYPHPWGPGAGGEAMGDSEAWGEPAGLWMEDERHNASKRHGSRQFGAAVPNRPGFDGVVAAPMRNLHQHYEDMPRSGDRQRPVSAFAPTAGVAPGVADRLAHGDAAGLYAGVPWPATTSRPGECGGHMPGGRMMPDAPTWGSRADRLGGGEETRPYTSTGVHFRGTESAPVAGPPGYFTLTDTPGGPQRRWDTWGLELAGSDAVFNHDDATTCGDPLTSPLVLDEEDILEQWRRRRAAEAMLAPGGQSAPGRAGGHPPIDDVSAGILSAGFRVAYDSEPEAIMANGREATHFCAGEGPLGSGPPGYAGGRTSYACGGGGWPGAAVGGDQGQGVGAIASSSLLSLSSSTAAGAAAAGGAAAAASGGGGAAGPLPSDIVLEVLTAPAGGRQQDGTARACPKLTLPEMPPSVLLSTTTVAEPGRGLLSATPSLLQSTMDRNNTDAGEPGRGGPATAAALQVEVLVANASISMVGPRLVERDWADDGEAPGGRESSDPLACMDTYPMVTYGGGTKVPNRHASLLPKLSDRFSSPVPGEGVGSFPADGSSQAAAVTGGSVPSRTPAFMADALAGAMAGVGAPAGTRADALASESAGIPSGIPLAGTVTGEVERRAERRSPVAEARRQCGGGGGDDCTTREAGDREGESEGEREWVGQGERGLGSAKVTTRGESSDSSVVGGKGECGEEGLEEVERECNASGAQGSLVGASIVERWPGGGPEVVSLPEDVETAARMCTRGDEHNDEGQVVRGDIGQALRVRPWTDAEVDARKLPEDNQESNGGGGGGGGGGGTGNSHRVGDIHDMGDSSQTDSGVALLGTQQPGQHSSPCGVEGLPGAMAGNGSRNKAGSPMALSPVVASLLDGAIAAALFSDDDVDACSTGSHVPGVQGSGVRGPSRERDAAVGGSAHAVHVPGVRWQENSAGGSGHHAAARPTKDPGSDNCSSRGTPGCGRVADLCGDDHPVPRHPAGIHGPGGAGGASEQDTGDGSNKIGAPKEDPGDDGFGVPPHSPGSFPESPGAGGRHASSAAHDESGAEEEGEPEEVAVERNRGRRREGTSSAWDAEEIHSKFTYSSTQSTWRWERINGHSHSHDGKDYTSEDEGDAKPLVQAAELAGLAFSPSIARAADHGEPDATAGSAGLGVIPGRGTDHGLGISTGGTDDAHASSFMASGFGSAGAPVTERGLGFVRAEAEVSMGLGRAAASHTMGFDPIVRGNHAQADVPAGYHAEASMPGTLPVGEGGEKGGGHGGIMSPSAGRCQMAASTQTETSPSSSIQMAPSTAGTHEGASAWASASQGGQGGHGTASGSRDSHSDDAMAMPVPAPASLVLAGTASIVPSGACGQEGVGRGVSWQSGSEREEPWAGGSAEKQYQRSLEDSRASGSNAPRASCPNVASGDTQASGPGVVLLDGEDLGETSGPEDGGEGEENEVVRRLLARVQWYKRELRRFGKQLPPPCQVAMPSSTASLMSIGPRSWLSAV